MAEEKKNSTKRKVPTFLRNDWHKKIKLGRGVKKNQKWRGAKGRQNKIRLGRRGHPARPKIGYSQPTKLRNKIDNLNFTRIENVKKLESLKKGDAIIIASVGAKKKAQIIESATKAGLTILNKYNKMEKKE
jgi:large subunit ribosomal protein L32e